MWRRLAIGAILVAIYAVVYYYMHFYIPPESKFLLRIQKIQCEVTTKDTISSLFPVSDYDQERFRLAGQTEVWVIFFEKPSENFRTQIVEEGKRLEEVMDFAQWDPYALIVSFDESEKVTGYRWERGLKRGVLADR